ncbi:hypothetical protein PENTCL1PPCAC_21430, partial [Pristionchus entomophagus]
FSERFCLPECIDALEEKYSHAISSDLAKILTTRKEELQSINEKRQKLILHYERGDIVCSLFDDIHPVLVNSLTENLDVVSYMAGNHPPGHNLEKR